MKAQRQTTGSDEASKLHDRYGCGPVQFTGAYNALYERHVVFDNIMEATTIGARERFEAIARSVRDILSQRPAYQLAKVIIKFINNLADTIDGDPAVRARLKVLFLPDYSVSLAERLIPASDVSNQISTAGYEASGTSNMKFMMNGALTIGTRDGATIEMAEEAGEENFFLFGLTVDQVVGSRGWYRPQWHYDNEPETRAALDIIFSNHFSRYEPGVFDPLRDALLEHGDYYMHLADLTSYLEADKRLCDLYADSRGWSRKAILNIAGSGKFSSDRTIAEYATDIWQVESCPVPSSDNPES